MGGRGILHNQRPRTVEESTKSRSSWQRSRADRDKGSKGTKRQQTSWKWSRCLEKRFHISSIVSGPNRWIQGKLPLLAQYWRDLSLNLEMQKSTEVPSRNTCF